MLDQRRLADTGFAGNQTTVRLPLHARSQAPCSRESASARPMKDGACGGGLGTIGLDAWRSVSHWGGDEAVASPRHRFDEARLAGIVVERRPQLADRGSQHRVGDELVAPDLIEQAFVVSRDPGCRTSAHSTANGVGARATGFPSRSRRAFASSSSNVRSAPVPDRTGRRSGVVGTFSHFDTNGSLDRHATTMA